LVSNAYVATGYQDLLQLEEHVSNLVGQLRIHYETSDSNQKDLIVEEDIDTLSSISKSRMNLSKAKSTNAVSFNTEKVSVPAADRLGRIEVSMFSHVVC
jgi:hypothetical protein